MAVRAGAAPDVCEVVLGASLCVLGKQALADQRGVVAHGDDLGWAVGTEACI